MSLWAENCRSLWRHRPAATAVAVLALGALGVLAVHHARGEHQWRQAQRLVLRREFEQAQPYVATCLERWPDDPAVQLLAARLARLRKQPSEAFPRLEQARKLHGNAERIVLEQYLMRAQRGELADVEKKLLAFLNKDDPDRPFIYDVLTFQWMMTQRFNDALPRLEAWQRLQPELTEPLIRRAWVLERLTDFPAAIAAYQEALDLDPEKDRGEGDRVRLRLSELLLARFRPQEAVAGFELLAERRPDNPEVLLGLARCRIVLGDAEDGIRLLEKLLAAEPNHGKALAELGRALQQQERWQEAADRLRRALKTQPFEKTLVHSLHQCMLKLGDKVEAKQLELRLERIIADERLMAQLMKDVLQSPQDPLLRQQIGEVFLRNEMAEDGLLWLRSALNFDPNYTPALEALAEWWESRGADEKAAPHREALARLGIAKKAVNRFRDQH